MNANEKDRIREALTETRTALLQWAKTLHENDWMRPVYAHDETWTALDVFRHLTWAEGGMARLIQQIRKGEKGVPADFDLNSYNARGVAKLSDKTPAELMDMMSQNRVWVLSILEEIDQDDLQLEGRHGSLRVMTIAEIFGLIAAHERRHLKDLRQALADD